MLETGVTEDTPRRGGWWLHFTAPPLAGQYDRAANRATREHLRHAQLTSYIAPFVFLAPLLLLQQAATNGSTAIGIAVLMGMAALALVLNRTGQQVLAALLLVLAMDGVIEGSLVTAAGGLGSGWLLTFDLFVIPLITVGVLLNRRFLWVFMIIHIGCIVGDYYFLPHAKDLNDLILLWHGATVAYARPLIIQIGGGLLCWLAVRSADEAILRADRAQFVAELQSSIASEKQRLEDGIQALLVMLTNASNGNMTVQASLPRESELWRIGQAIEMLFTRLQSGRLNEQRTQHLLKDIQILTSLVHAARSGQTVQWPAASGSILDPLVREMGLLVASSKSSIERSGTLQPKNDASGRMQ